MKALGFVEWTNRDKNGNPIAGMRPLVELQKGEWRTIDALEEFPTQGLAFWFNAHGAVEGSLFTFQAEPNPGEKKDEFQVSDPRPVIEVLDLQQFGTAIEVRSALAEGIQLPGPRGNSRVLILCKPGLLVGPVEVCRVNGTVTLVGKNLHRVPAYAEPQLRRLNVIHFERLLRVDDKPASHYVDWDDDAAVLRRALSTVVKVASQPGTDAAKTKKQLDETVRALSAQGVGADAALERFRLERALALLENTDLVVQIANSLSEGLREHPVIKASFEELRARVRTEVETGVRADLEQRLARERNDLKEATNAHAQMRLELAATQQKLEEVEKQIAESHARLESVASEAETTINARLLAAAERPQELLAEVSLLRPFFGVGLNHAKRHTSTQASVRVVQSVGSGTDVKDKAALLRSLAGAARARGVDPSLMLQVHAAIAADLMPITFGPSALAALTAYAHGACGGRLFIIHVSPSTIHPFEFDDVPGGGLLAAIAAARDVDGVTVAVLEGANRSPLEASLLPQLQLRDSGLSPLSNARGLRLAASLVAGATTVPVTPQLWSHAAAIYPEPSSRSTQTNETGDVALSSELFAPGDEPTAVIESLLDSWPDCSDLRPSMCRFGSALTRLYNEEQRIAEALLNGLVLPYVATALTDEEQGEALSKVKDVNGSTAAILRRLRRRLA